MKKVDLQKQTSSSTIIFVDRKIRPIYPDWVKEVMHPDLELSGPKKYDISSVKILLHDEQKDGVVKGHVVYKYLKETEILKLCLNLQDGRAIQQKGITFFKEFFGDETAIPLLKSIVRDRYGNNGDLHFPYIYGLKGMVVELWCQLDSFLDSSCPIAHFLK